MVRKDETRHARSDQGKGLAHPIAKGLPPPVEGGDLEERRRN